MAISIEIEIEELCFFAAIVVEKIADAEIGKSREADLVVVLLCGNVE